MSEPPPDQLRRPATLKDVSVQSQNLEEFGYNLRDWQHEVSRLVTSRKQLSGRIEEAPPVLSSKFAHGDVADAYLAAYAEWLALSADIDAPAWSQEKTRTASTAWYADSNRSQLERLAPDSFKKRGLFTVPDNIFRPRKGRPRVSAESKRQKSIQRQRAYRKRIKALVEKARAAEAK
ncbi:hypothetical protein [Pelagicoccus sp. SDUM812005]|uniref:hypothetical protein n=1 Tax=Pelagicoccus sp. SDUM812005 TaxID=3041257 RepID=UPI00280DD4DB|nr:hypothetical protein [Pelagicoccus sp. SDUM812005]MDQ8180347.1 hypothetical protein [Pelagicoccus sp. SDUM812005]